MKPTLPIAPSARYAWDCHHGGMVADPVQAKVIECLDQMYGALRVERHRRSAWWLCWRKRQAVRGAYIWGPVGTGKTYCLDSFCEAVGAHRLWRVHFHAFMQYVHAQLRWVQGCQSPMHRVMQDLAKQYDVLCLDEFLVADITDAMLLHAVLEGVSREGMSLVVTGNTAPDDLYRHGLQRSRFMPAIAWLKQHLKVVHCDPQQDYRRRSTATVPVYFTPLGEVAKQQMLATFDAEVASVAMPQPGKSLVLAGRPVPTLGCVAHVVWFAFEVICGVPRAVADYLAIARDFDVVMVSDVPVLTHAHPSRVVNFMRMIDVLYDARLRVILSVAAEPDVLYGEGPYAEAFARTQSRLYEMRHDQWVPRGNKN